MDGLEQCRLLLRNLSLLTHRTCKKLAKQLLFTFPVTALESFSSMANETSLERACQSLNAMNAVCSKWIEFHYHKIVASSGWFYYYGRPWAWIEKVLVKYWKILPNMSDLGPLMVFVRNVSGKDVVELFFLALGKTALTIESGEECQQFVTMLRVMRQPFMYIKKQVVADKKVMNQARSTVQSLALFQNGQHAEELKLILEILDRN